ncbi:hypothetical protein ACYJW8_13925 [Frateuria aurantia]
MTKSKLFFQWSADGSARDLDGARTVCLHGAAIRAAGVVMLDAEVVR